MYNYAVYSLSKSNLKVTILHEYITLTMRHGLLANTVDQGFSLIYPDLP
jgi:hypothetical protein